MHTLHNHLSGVQFERSTLPCGRARISNTPGERARIEKRLHSIPSMSIMARLWGGNKWGVFVPAPTLMSVDRSLANKAGLGEACPCCHSSINNREIRACASVCVCARKIQTEVQPREGTARAREENQKCFGTPLASVPHLPPQLLSPSLDPDVVVARARTGASSRVGGDWISSAVATTASCPSVSRGHACLFPPVGAHELEALVA